MPKGIRNVDSVRDIYYTQKELGKRFEINQATVCKVVNMKQWKDTRKERIS